MLPPPFPQRLVKQKKDPYKDVILEQSKKVAINIPFDSGEHFKELEKVMVSEKVSAILQ